MNVLTGYIVREILKGSFVALILLLTLFNLFTFSDELKDLGKGRYGLTEIFKYLALTSPRVFFELVPSSALIGSLFVLGAMGNNRELIAMRASGVSVLSIIRAVMTAGAVLVLISIAVGEFIAPTAEKAAQVLKVEAKNDKVVIQGLYGLWLREGRQFINVRQIQDNGDLADVYVYEINGRNRPVRVRYAEKAGFLGNDEWHLEKIKQSDVSTQRVLASEVEAETWKSAIDPDLLNVVVVSPDNMSLFDLGMYVQFLKENKQKSQAFELAFWARLINPLVTFVMLLLATPFVIGVKRGVSTGARMMIGVLLGMGFNILDKIVGHLSLVYDISPALMASLPSIIVLAIAMYTVRRVM